MFMNNYQISSRLKSMLIIHKYLEYNLAVFRWVATLIQTKIVLHTDGPRYSGGLGSRKIPRIPRPGNTEQGKCWLTNEYPIFLFLIGHWYYEKNILYL
jgi:hypothetical protein